MYSVVGAEGLTRLVRAFYSQVPNDDLLGAMYPKDDLAASEQRLRDFLVYRFGGPQRYIVERGHPRLRARHQPFRLDQRARDRWVALMDSALDQAELPSEVVELLRGFFHDTATFLVNTREP